MSSSRFEDLNCSSSLTLPIILGPLLSLLLDLDLGIGYCLARMWADVIGKLSVGKKLNKQLDQSDKSAMGSEILGPEIQAQSATSQMNEPSKAIPDLNATPQM
ncbi:unnamed protein product [Anisakis simplex]|uniref:Pentatricopeptide repeat-containing protein n=1 Tax=Anisakis simplex TaxID=6269 RepID=A0A0M3K0W8_ANISI|nr:unnamed protein product [Anisakis simplex]